MYRDGARTTREPSSSIQVLLSSSIALPGRLVYRSHSGSPKAPERYPGHRLFQGGAMRLQPQCSDHMAVFQLVARYGHDWRIYWEGGELRDRFLDAIFGVKSTCRALWQCLTCQRLHYRIDIAHCAPMHMVRVTDVDGPIIDGVRRRGGIEWIVRSPGFPRGDEVCIDLY